MCQTVVNATRKYKAGRKDGTIGRGRHCHKDDTDPVTWK